MQMLQFLQYVFLGLSILQIPALYIYSQGSAYAEPSELLTGGWDWYMLGNLGYSSVSCESTPINGGFIGL